MSARTAGARRSPWRWDAKGDLRAADFVGRRSTGIAVNVTTCSPFLFVLLAGRPVESCHHLDLRKILRSGSGHLTASRESWASMGSRNDSVFPDPVPDVTIPGCPLWIP